MAEAPAAGIAFDGNKAALGSGAAAEGGVVGCRHRRRPFTGLSGQVSPFQKRAREIAMLNFDEERFRGSSPVRWRLPSPSMR